MATIKINNNLFFVISLLLVSLLFLHSCKTKEGEENYIKFKKLRDTHQYFAYKGDSSILVSGHRGGREAGYPENSIEGFQHVLSQMPAFFEVDPRLTKDSIIVLMHDATLDRTTDATGNLSDYTFSELQSVRLKDHEGNVTSAKIPTLEEVIKWSKGKTVVNLDKKDVPLHMIVELIKKHKAEKHVMLTVHTGAQARYYSDRLPGIMLSIFARNDEEFEDIAISGVPWENMIAYVGQTINDSNRHIVEQLRAKGVRCMVSYAPSLDRLRTAEERESAYRQAIRISPDIIESDYPVEVWKVLKD
ncbi:glycerophosphodiester phosphodiesterase family protein [Proteiniphilum acetatigenes]|uniref:glycerophosphodiester phosphodiesterase family protein n=1 Tax=Proteiniphilum acetatigenes TaxID=294710 RepID=UPI00036FB0F3|nr:glycerophosphodiester phosphodiesterase family protein [Proteiniphilum acetatigenes]SFK82783.1 glycerophosphoryl diester phosphodiesterase [Porphyromonadaceae bacterium KH3CP3RA]